MIYRTMVAPEQTSGMTAEELEVYSALYENKFKAESVKATGEGTIMIERAMTPGWSLKLEWQQAFPTKEVVGAGGRGWGNKRVGYVEVRWSAPMKTLVEALERIEALSSGKSAEFPINGEFIMAAKLDEINSIVTKLLNDGGLS